MEKMSLHETLRIYIPGLLFVILLAILLTNKIENPGYTAVIALFVAFALNYPFHIISNRFFKYLVVKYQIKIGDTTGNFAIQHHRILATKLAIYKPDAEFVAFDEEWQRNMTSIEYGYFAQIYDSSTISCFRVPKSFGLMCFNLALAALSSIIIFFITWLVSSKPLIDWHYYVVGTGIVLSALFFLSARSFLRRSLEQEIYYWSGISEGELDHYMHLVKLTKRMKM